MTNMKSSKSSNFRVAKSTHQPKTTKPKSTEESDRKILVAVDFGTTYSGLAWAQTRKPDIQNPIIMWPDASSEGLEGITCDKVPTEILYNGNGFKWGFEIQESESRHQWFKLELDSSTHIPSLAQEYPDRLAAPPAFNMSPEKLAIDYLTALRRHAERVLRYKLPPSALDSTPIEYVITVPAVWSDKSMAITRTCAAKAGMGDGCALQIISEPEAAAIYALDAMDTHDIKIGDTFLLVDAGGGTVDLIMYSIAELKPVLKLIEASPGTGACCGSSILNRRFYKFLEEKLSGEPGWGSEVIEDAMKFFETTIKKQFRGLQEQKFLVPVPGIANNSQLGVIRNKFTLSGSQMRLIFEPILAEVMGLVMAQIKTSKQFVTAILLVGGFSQNVYLRDEIRKEVKAYSPTTVLIQSPNGWTAVVRGALMKGLMSTSLSFATVQIKGRSARKHYGIQLGVPWSESIGDKHRTYWDNFEGGLRIRQMRWFLRKGCTVEEDKPLRIACRRNFKTSAGHIGSVPTIISCCSDPLDKGAPKYVDDAGVQTLVRVSADLSQIPINIIPVKMGADRQAYYRIEFAIEVTFYSAYTSYEMIYQGVSYGHATAEYV